MKKYIKPTILAVLMIVAGVMSTNAVKSIAAPQTENAIPTEVLSIQNAEFWLRDCDGLVGVFRGKAENPIEITDIKTETLNDTDRAMLLHGIPAEDRQALLMLLEDFSS